jgi:hypothetical protein
MRLEMPAIAVVAAVLFAGRRFSALRKMSRASTAMALAFGTYLSAITLSSTFVAPGTAQSLHMVAWLGISMLGGVVAFILMRPRPLDSIEPLALGGAVMGAAGILAAAAFFLAGPSFELGIQDAQRALPRVYALGWEANLYAIFLGMCVFFALEVARGPRPVTGFALLALALVGLPLGVTRAAYICLAAGAIAYVVVRLAAQRRSADLPRFGLIAGSLIVIGFVAASVLLPNAAERSALNGIGQVPPATPAATTGRASAAPSASAGAPASAVPTATAAPVPSVKADPDDDTLAFRLERVPIAVNDFPESPLIGFGAESFGQRHPERYAGPGPDHIAIMAVVVPYESGIIGAVALTTGFALLLMGLWRVARDSLDPRMVGAAAAFIGALVSMLVGYQSNNALQFAVNWILIGAGAALAARETPGRPGSAGSGA